MLEAIETLQMKIDRNWERMIAGEDGRMKTKAKTIEAPTGMGIEWGTRVKGDCMEPHVMDGEVVWWRDG